MHPFIITLAYRFRVLAGLVLLMSLFGPSTLAKQTAVGKGRLPIATVARHHRQVRRQPHLAPTLLQLTPNEMQVGVPNPLNGRNPTSVDLIVTGRGFKQGASVRWNQKPLKTSFVSSTRLEAKVPFDYLSLNRMAAVKQNSPGGSGPGGMGPDGATGVASVQVSNPGGRVSGRLKFTVSYVVVGG